MMFQKYCKRCNTLFRPKGKYCYLCESCRKPKGRGPIPKDTELQRNKKAMVELRNRVKSSRKGATL